MTRKDYERLAAELAEQYRDMTDPAEVRGFWAAVCTVCDALERDNPRFDRNRFTDAVRG